MSEQSLALPGRDDLSRFGVVIDRELHAGKQSRVFRGTVDGREVAVKLTDARTTTAATLAERMSTVEALAGVTEAVAAPVRIAGELTHPVGGWLVTATPFIAGRQVDISVEADARLLGRTLGELHAALGELGERELPPVAALDLDDGRDRSQWQLVHGDFSDQNMIVTSNGVKVFDFDDCGYGPVLYDVANSLYMVLFDAEVHANDDRYAAFRAPFLDAYGNAMRASVEIEIVDSFIDARIDALGRWLDDLPSAPIGIRSSSPEWQAVLRSFVAAHHTPGTAGSR